MEASALNHSARASFLAGRSPHLRLQRDERLIALVRRGNQGAFEVLVKRYEARLLAFCRSMLGSTEDAEDVLQEVFAAAYRAICADDRAINARPWLYRIARNRCLNHLRAPRHAGQDSMDIFERDGGTTTAETVQRREDFRVIVKDVQTLPETQRTALLLREMEALSYDQIAIAMDTTVPAVKSLLVRARVSLAEAAEARSLTCDEVRLQLGRAQEGIGKLSAPMRRHVKSCSQCTTFRGELKRTSKALAAIYPIAPLIVLKQLFAFKVGTGAAGGGAGSAGGGLVGAGSAVGGVASVALAPVAAKGAAGLAAAAILTAGAVEVERVRDAGEQPARVTQDRALKDAAAGSLSADRVVEKSNSSRSLEGLLAGRDRRSHGGRDGRSKQLSESLTGENASEKRAPGVLETAVTGVAPTVDGVTGLVEDVAGGGTAPGAGEGVPPADGSGAAPPATE
nr:RNA polymerase sigma factor [Thermoleophilaceae bacterium]